MLLRKIIAFAFLIFNAFGGGQNFIAAQTKKPSAPYAAPRRLALKGNEEIADQESGRFSLLTEEFYPVGWSKDGKFAYYTEPADEACGCYFAQLVIQDLRTDKILWMHTNVNGEFGDEPVDETIKSYWKKHQKEFSAKLAEYQIVPTKNFALLDFPFKYRGDVLTPELKADLIQGEDVYVVKGSVVVRIISKAKGAKTIYEKRYQESELDGIRGAEIGGVLLSPFESRGVVIIVETYRGWEGPPHTTRIRVVGTNLTDGFR